MSLLPLFLLAALLVSILLTTGALAAPLLSPAFQESPAQPASPPASPSAPQPTATPQATAGRETAPTATPQTNRRKGSPRENPPDLVIDWPMFIDTVVVAISYFWLCCGGLAIVGVPLVLGMAYTLGQRRTVPPPGNPESKP